MNKNVRNKGQKKGYSELSKLDPTPDTRTPKCTGYLASNIVNYIKQKAVDRNKEWSLSPIEAYYFIIGTCEYCGFKPDWPNNRIGIDRVDSSLGYIPSNCVSCCFTCNSAKGEKTVEEFRDWLRRIHTYQKKKARTKSQPSSR
jgi:5-methylcytosine-specific restriction endonuclease McrA